VVRKPKCLEHLRIPQRLEDRPIKLPGQVHLPGCLVIEPQPKNMIANVSRFEDV
jgi:hypothetical protein